MTAKILICPALYLKKWNCKSFWYKKIYYPEAISSIMAKLDVTKNVYFQMWKFVWIWFFSTNISHMNDDGIFHHFKKITIMEHFAII